MRLIEQAVDPKDPAEAKFYSFDLSDALNAGATVSAAVWSCPGLTFASESTTDTTAVAKISGGRANQDYAVVCTITTSDGETVVVAGKLKVRHAADGAGQ